MNKSILHRLASESDEQSHNGRPVCSATVKLTIISKHMGMALLVY